MYLFELKCLLSFKGMALALPRGPRQLLALAPRLAPLSLVSDLPENETELPEIESAPPEIDFRLGGLDFGKVGLVF